MAGLKVNWADIIFDTIKKHHSTFLPYGAFLTFIFKKIKVDLKNEMNVVSNFELFDYTVLLRMKIPSLISLTEAGLSPSTHHNSQPQDPSSTYYEEPHVFPPSSYDFQ